MKSKAFTLVECILVVVALGVLAAIAIPKVLRSQERTIFSEAKQTLLALMGAQRSYRLDIGNYTSVLSNLDISFPTLKYFTSLAAVQQLGTIGPTDHDVPVGTIVRTGGLYTLLITDAGNIFCFKTKSNPNVCASISCKKTGPYLTSSFNTMCN